MRKDEFRFDRTGVLQEPTYETFGCKVFKEDPATPDKLAPDVVLHRHVHTDGELIAPDGRRIEVWGFADPKSSIASDRRAPYPSPPIRVRQGQLVHTQLKSKKGPHTIHHHGINPTTFNDGVGHVSFEAGKYTYQWQPHNPGTNFYHCHRNTVLHFEMGMFGLLIVDPPEGPGFLLNGERYQVEKFWVADDMDPRWHDQVRDRGHDAGLCGEDVGLHLFEPKYFLLSGAFSNKTMSDKRAVVKARVGETILIRLLNASYSILRVKLEIDAMLIGIDGHSIRNEPWERTVPIPAGQWFELASAQRYALIIKPTVRGTVPVRMEFRHWITRTIQDGGRGVINTTIEVV